jgi:hypothetical protein
MNMKIFLAIFCAAAIVSSAVPLNAKDKDIEYDPTESEEVYREKRTYGEDIEPYEPKRKSVATAALLSVAPSFGAGLYYSGDYYMAISSTLGMATGLGLLLDGLLRTNNDGTIVSGVTLLGTSWLLGVIYAPLSAHQYNKSLEEEEYYGMRPYISTSGKNLYAGVSGKF